MALTALTDWFGNYGSKSIADELKARNIQRLSEKAKQEREEKLAMEADKCEYIKELIAQKEQDEALLSTENMNKLYMQMAQNLNTSLYNGLANTSNTNWNQAALQAQYMAPGSPQYVTGYTTTTGTASIPTVINNPGHMHMYPGAIYSSTGTYQQMPQYVGQYGQAFPMMPSNPSVGDKLIYEWDGQTWTAKYESKPVAPKSVKMTNIEFSLDEIEEASKLVEDLSRREEERAAA